MPAPCSSFFAAVWNFGMFKCVSTASTPGTACAALVSIAVIFPFAMLLSTVHPCAHFGTSNSTAYFAAPVTFNRPSTRLRAGPIVAALIFFVWVARASRALVSASRRNRLSRKVHDGETPSPTRETRALPNPKNSCSYLHPRHRCERADDAPLRQLDLE